MNTTKILGFSGSPIRNSNTDRLVQHVLQSSGQSSEFIKLSKLNIRPCLACKGCVKDNICKVKDDFQSIANKIKNADAIVLGTYTPYGVMDGFTKALLERLFSMRHINSLLKDKLVISVVASVYEDVRMQAHRSIVTECIVEKMKHIGMLNISGSNPCYTCGAGNDCENSIKSRMGCEVDLSLDNLIPVEKQAVWEKASLLGKRMGNIISGDEEYNPHNLTLEISDKLKQRYLDMKQKLAIQ